MKRWIALLAAAVCMVSSAVPVGAASQKQEQTEQTKLIALTFDDGPGQYTGKLLDALAQRNVKVTFFILGCNAQIYPDTVRRAYNEGHQIANHTYSHGVLTGQSDEKVKSEITKTTEILNEICGGETEYLLRPPCGECDERILSLAGCPAVTWSVDPMDWRDQNAQTVADRITDAAYDGAVILAHDLYETTVDGAVMAIDRLQQEGYEFVTVNELFRRRGLALKNGSLYCRCRPTGTQLPAISQPVISVETATDGVCVTMRADEGAKIYYTTDGTEPSRNSKVYTEPVVLHQTCTLRAVAVYQFNGSRSDTASVQIPMGASAGAAPKRVDRSPSGQRRKWETPAI